MGKKRENSIFDIIYISFRYAPAMSFLITINKVLLGIEPIIEVIVTAKFINTSIDIAKGKSNFFSVYAIIILEVLLISYRWIGKQLNKFIEVKIQNQLKETLRVGITEKRAKLKYKYIEDNETWDLINRVSKKPEIQNKDAYVQLLDLFNLVIRTSGVLIILFTKVWWVPIVIVLISLPLFKLASISGKANYQANRDATNYTRRYEYLSNIITDRENVDERTVFQYGNKINTAFSDYYEKTRKKLVSVQLKWFAKMKLGSIITAALSCSIIAVLINPLYNGEMTIGLFTAIINESLNLIELMSWSLTRNIDNLTKNLEYLKDLSIFMSLDEVEGAIDTIVENPIVIDTLEFKNVKFKYPGSDNYILDGVSFKIEKGKNYAFVGVNGAGKTTITKLITGLYDEYEGEILINDKNLKEYSYVEIKSMSSVVHQDFAKYQISFKDNIAIGNINNIENNNYSDVIKAINTIKLDDAVKDLPNRIDNNLGKIKEDGVDISGGQWQRIAIARSIVSKATLRILDEPTAALDPISESNIYKNFRDISQEGTTIFISHRLGSAKIAEKIFVLGDGRIIEEGSHDELINLHGIYENMFESQRSWYL